MSTPSSVHRQRALLLLEQGRPELALPELKLAVSADPHDPFLHALSALCLVDLDRPAEAVDAAREAIAAAPDDGFAHYALGRAELAAGRNAAAEGSVARAIAIDPFEPTYHALRAEVMAARGRWPASLEAADAALALDPEDVPAANLRAQALVHLGRRDEAARALGAALGRDPDNSYTHANTGWARLHRGESREALDAFREALRLDPRNDWARAGLVEALKARNPVYGALLRYFLWMSRLPPRTQVIVVVGGLLGYNALRTLAEATPALRPLVLPLMVLYVGFVLLSWTADQLFNVVLLTSPFGRHALSAEERRNALLLSALVVSGAGLLGAAWATGSGPLLLAGLVSFALMLPVAGAIRSRGRLRGALAILSGALAVTGYAGAALLGAGIAAGGGLLTVTFWGSVLSTWAANLGMMRR